MSSSGQRVPAADTGSHASLAPPERGWRGAPRSPGDHRDRGFIRFGDVKIDRIKGRLWRGDTEVSLRSKTLALLRHLAAHADRVVPRDELLRAVWGGRVVSAGVVRISVREVRNALGEGVIETVGRRGYRFAPEATGVALAAPIFVGRETELARLHEPFEVCRTKRRQFAFVSGEPGIGKSALVTRFADAIEDAGLGRVVRGQCVDLRGSAEPYLPILEALEHLGEGDDRRTVRGILQRWAPSWMLHMPGLLDAAATQALRQRVPNPTRDRMLREFADALEALARDTPLALVLEDLHWSDASTMDLLAYVAERTTPAKLLVVATYRPVEATSGEHSLRDTVRDLLARRRGVEIPIEPLARDDVETFLSRLLTGATLDDGLCDIMHARTDGNPLFLTAVVEHLIEHGGLVSEEGRWQLRDGADAVPPSLRELVAHELAALDADDRAMLTAASVAGIEFDATSVAAAAGQPVDRVEQSCGRLASDGRMVRATGTTTWPDGAISGTYRFLHGLHRDAVYDRIPPAERARFHRAIGSTLEAGWAGDPARVATVLALHFELGADVSKATQYHVAAINAAKARLADREVVAHSRAALALLERLPPSTERDNTEMDCTFNIASSLLAAQGYGLPEIERRFARARDLAIALENPITEFLARGGLYVAEVMGGDQRRALALASDLMAMAERFPMPIVTLIGNTTVGGALYNLGHLTEARRHLERARDAWDPALPRIQLDQRVLFLGIGALALLQLGDRPTATAWNEELLEYARGLDDPLNAAHAFNLMAPWHLWLDDRPRGLACAEQALAIAVEHGFGAHQALATFLRGAALNDLAVQREGFAALQAGGYRVVTPTHRLQMARTLLGQERVNEAREQLDLALAEIEARGEARHLAEVHRARAECAVASGQRAEAEAALQAALAVASQQEARLFEEWARADLERLTTTP